MQEINIFLQILLLKACILPCFQNRVESCGEKRVWWKFYGWQPFWMNLETTVHLFHHQSQTVSGESVPECGVCRFGQSLRRLLSFRRVPTEPAGAAKSADMTRPSTMTPSGSHQMRFHRPYWTNHCQCLNQVLNNKKLGFTIHCCLGGK